MAHETLKQAKQGALHGEIRGMERPPEGGYAMVELDDEEFPDPAQLRQWLEAPGGTLACSQFLKVRDREGRLQRLIANAAQRRFEEHRGRQNIILKARQMGMTTWISARFFLRTMAYPGTMTLQVAHTRSAAESIFRGVQRMWENLPEELRKGPLKRRRANVGQMVFKEIDSEFRVASACDAGAGRGLSLQNLHCSEVSRWPGNAAETLAGLRAALAPEGELVLESTPNGAYGPFYEEWLSGIDDPKGEGLVRHFLPWWMEPAYTGSDVAESAMDEEELALLDAHRLSGRQIGFRRSLVRSYGALRSQEFAEDAETCFRATGDCCFEVDAIEKRLSEVVEPYRTSRNGALQYWAPAVANKQYVVAVDSAGGGSNGDFAAIQVVDRETGMQCAELQQRLRPLELAAVAANLAREFGYALIAVERNNHGAAVLAFLDQRERYTRLYAQSGEPGWLTTSVSKPEMIGHLGALLVERSNMFASRRLLAECRTYVSGEHGKTNAASGSHDDLVMAMAIAQKVRGERL